MLQCCKDKLGSKQLNHYAKIVTNYSTQLNPKVDYNLENVVHDNPDPSGRLKNTFVTIYQKVVHKMGSNHKPLIHTIPHKSLKAHKSKVNLWRSTLNLKWPQEMTFESWSTRKVLAERSNIKAALEKLREMGVLDKDDQPDLNAGTVLKNMAPILARLNPPSPIWVEPTLASQIDFITSEYKRLESSIKTQPFKTFHKPTGPMKLSQLLTDEDSEALKEIEDGMFREFVSGEGTSRSVNKVKNIINGQILTSLDAKRREVINAQLFHKWQSTLSQSMEHNPGNRDNEQVNIYRNRQSLPIALKRDEILEIVAANPVVVLCGDTGSGKSTQMPQYLREWAIERGRAVDCAVLVTQPRRISAISLARRLAYEMGDEDHSVLHPSRRPADDQLTVDVESGDRAAPGWNHVGFHVRLFQKVPREVHQAPILFCTPGILLRKLQQNPDLLGVSHVIVDEVHEHDVLTDFLMAVLKGVTQRNPTLRVILMSATINTEKFSRYFGNCPIINVKGRMFPVESFYLPEVCQLIAQKPTQPTTKSTQLSDSREMVKNVEKCGTAQTTIPRLDSKLFVQTITHIHESEGGNGAVLAFLPGWSEIKKVRDDLEYWNRVQYRNSKNSSKRVPPMHVFTVHSSLSQEEQAKIFTPARKLPGRKVILSTNITETAVTIDDVVYVVDSGLAKENKYNTETGVSYLDMVWASKSNIRQRQGRAGRVRPGKSYHLFSREFYNTLPDHPVPEILRIPLETIILEAKLISSTFGPPGSTSQTNPVLGCKAEDFLSSLIVPPTQEAIKAALTILRDELGFLDQNENLTHLGQRLVGVACHPRLSLAMAWASFFRCPGHVITLAAAMSHNRSLLLPTARVGGLYGLGTDNQEGAGGSGSNLRDIKLKYAPVPGSDHLAHVKIYEMWRQSYEMGRDFRLLYEEENSIDGRNARFIDGVRSQLSAELAASGLAQRSELNALDTTTTPGQSNTFKLLRAILGASFYPNVAKVVYGDVKKGHLIKEARRLIAAGSCNRNGLIVPSSDSLCSDREHYDTDWVTFLNCLKLPHRNNASICRDLSTFPPIALILLAGRKLEILTEEEGLQEPDLAEHCKDGRVLLRLDFEPMLTFATRDTDTANRLIHLRAVILELFSHFLKVGITVENKNFEMFQEDDYEENSNNEARVLQLRKEVLNMCKRLIETNT